MSAPAGPPQRPQVSPSVPVPRVPAASRPRNAAGGWWEAPRAGSCSCSTTPQRSWLLPERSRGRKKPQEPAPASLRAPLPARTGFYWKGTGLGSRGDAHPDGARADPRRRAPPRPCQALILLYLLDKQHQPEQFAQGFQRCLQRAARGAGCVRDPGSSSRARPCFPYSWLPRMEPQPLAKPRAHKLVPKFSCSHLLGVRTHPT